MLGSMTPADPNRPRIGIPWRTSEEGLSSHRPWEGKNRHYARAVEKAGGEPVELALNDPQALQALLPALDGFVLPGSPADVDPGDYGRRLDSGLSAPPDPPREQTDRAILEHAFALKKPVLAICYGCQLLNVYLGGTLIEDLRTETGTQIAHRRKDLTPEPAEDPTHAARFETGSRLAALAGGLEAVINSSHHQSIDRLGRQLKITGRAPDGIIEGVEWTGDANWVTGVQWHPERMTGDLLAERLFSDFVQAVRNSRPVQTGKP
jgi:putative glutamine amidotransferase